MTFGQRSAGLASNAPDKKHLTDTEPKPFRSGPIFLSALLGSVVFFLLGAPYIALISSRQIGFQAAEKMIVSMIVIGIPATAVFYLIGLALSDLTFRAMRTISVAAYALGGLVLPSVLVTIFQLAMSGGRSGNYVVLTVIAPGGLVGGILLGLLRRRSATGVA